MNISLAISREAEVKIYIRQVWWDLGGTTTRFMVTILIIQSENSVVWNNEIDIIIANGSSVNGKWNCMMRRIEMAKRIYI